MKKALLVCLAASFLACSAPNLEQTAAWMDSQQKEAPGIDVSGNWESASGFMTGGWGYGSFSQSGAKVIGSLGMYSLEGRVSGKRLYATISSGSRVYYLAVMEPDAAGALSGIATRKAFPDSPEAKSAEKCPIILVRRKAAP